MRTDSLTRVNMGGNLPPKIPEVFEPEYRRALTAMLASRDITNLISNHLFMGTARDRTAGAAFIGRRFPQPPAADQVIITNGVQSTLTMILQGLTGSGGALAVEEFSYPAIGVFAKAFGLEIVTLPMDVEGLLPEGFETACRNRKVAALYTLPTCHNPTTATMSVERRKAIAQVARKHGVVLIEDDIYSLLPIDPPPPLSSFAPELSWYILGTAKSIAPGLKVAYTMAPTAEEAARYFWPGGKTTYWMGAPANVSVATELIEGGGVNRIIEAHRAEALRRQQQVVQRLAMATGMRTAPMCLQVWLPLPDKLEARRFVADLASRLVDIHAGDAYRLRPDGAVNTVRLGTGTPLTFADFERGLLNIAEVYAAGVA